MATTGNETMTQDGRIGLSIGRYGLVARVSGGRCGALYLAQHAAILSKVFVKVIPREAGVDAEVVGRYLAAVGRVNNTGHGGLARVRDCGQAEGIGAYLVLEHFPGNTLADLLVQGGADTAERSASLLGQLGAALQAMHDEGVVHRDLRPSGVALEEDAARLRGGLRCVLVDPGLGELPDDPAARPGPGDPPDEGVRYRAPEQWDGAGSGETDGGAADVYALAALAYHLLGGRLPFEAATVAEQRRLQEAGAPPAGGLPGWVPAEVDRALRRALDPDPGQRPARPGELGALLERALGEAAGEADSAPGAAVSPAARSAGPVRGGAASGEGDADEGGRRSHAPSAAALLRPPTGLFWPGAAGKAEQSGGLSAEVTQDHRAGESVEPPPVELASLVVDAPGSPPPADQHELEATLIEPTAGLDDRVTAVADLPGGEPADGQDPAAAPATVGRMERPSDEERIYVLGQGVGEGAEVLPPRSQLRLSLPPQDLRQARARCTVVANFVAAYLSGAPNPEGEAARAVTTVLGELLDNAARHGAGAEGPLELSLRQRGLWVGLTLAHDLEPEPLEDFAGFLEELAAEQDLERCCLERMTRPDFDPQRPRMGLLMLLKDFPLQLRVALRTPAGAPPRVNLTATCDLSRLSGE